MKELLDHNKYERLAEVCRRYHVLKLSLFGSTANGQSKPESDVDILVEFVPGKTPGFAFSDLQDELTLIFGRRVDLRTSEDLSKYFRQQVVKEAQSIYAA